MTDIHVIDQRENENEKGILRGPRGPKRIFIRRDIFMSVTNEKMSCYCKGGVLIQVDIQGI